MEPDPESWCPIQTFPVAAFLTNNTAHCFKSLVTSDRAADAAPSLCFTSTMPLTSVQARSSSSGLCSMLANSSVRYGS